MPPPTPLAIATSTVQRLLKEELSYHKELTQQEARLARSLEGAGTDGEDENAEFQRRQETAAIEETRAVFGPLRERIGAATEKLADRLEMDESAAGEAEVVKAKEVLKAAKEFLEKA